MKPGYLKLDKGRPLRRAPAGLQLQTTTGDWIASHHEGLDAAGYLLGLANAPYIYPDIDVNRDIYLDEPEREPTEAPAVYPIGDRLPVAPCGVCGAQLGEEPFYKLGTRELHICEKCYSDLTECTHCPKHKAEIERLRALPVPYSALTLEERKAVRQWFRDGEAQVWDDGYWYDHEPTVDLPGPNECLRHAPTPKWVYDVSDEDALHRPRVQVRNTNAGNWTDATLFAVATNTIYIYPFVAQADKDTDLHWQECRMLGRLREEWAQ